MRPAYSVILFTTLSGAGYGLLAVLGAAVTLGVTTPHPLAALVVGLGLASVGLVASTFHLGRPERAWRAFSQWRTSWLSREGVLAIAVYLAALPLGATLLAGAPSRLLAALTAVLAALTVWCTAMIYASLKPVPQWRLPTVPPAYGLLALASGAMAFQVFVAAEGIPAWLTALVASALAGAWVTKEIYWHAAARTRLPELAAATGLTAFREVRPLDPPHTESNYLLHEFGYRVARRHAERLRNLVRLFGFALPLLTALALAAWPSVALATVASLSAFLGILAERWLFFAEARHTVMLYYPAIR
jgi:DMSO reductase anchor subunit